MKRIIVFLLLFAAIKVAGQTTGYLRFDTVRIMKQNGTCELYIINKTKDSLGLLTNVGGGLTQFKRSRMLNDSTLIIGLDTLTVHGTGGVGTGSTNLNIGSGYRLAVPGTNNIKTLFDGLWVISDSTSNTNAITRKVDSAGLATYFLRRKDSALYVTPTRLKDTAAVLRSLVTSGVVNLDTSRNSTSATIIASGTDAVIKLVSSPANLAGLMSPIDKLRLDSLYNGDLTFPIPVLKAGAGLSPFFVRTDSLLLKGINCTGCTVATQSDSSLLFTVTATAPSGMAIDSNITGSTAKSILYVGDDGSMQQDPTRFVYDSTNNRIGLLTNTPASKLNIITNSLGTTLNDAAGIQLETTTAAAAGAQQMPPQIVFKGFGWRTTATAASRPITASLSVVPVQGTSNPDSYFMFQQSTNGGSYTQMFEIYPEGIRIGNGGGGGGGINLGGTPGTGRPTAGNISTTAGVAFTTSVTPNANTYDFSATAGWAQTTGASSLLRLQAGSTGFAPASGNGTHAQLWILPKINQNVSCTGRTYGVFVQPTLTSAIAFASFGTDVNSQYAFYQDGTSAKNYFAGETNIGSVTDQGAYTLQNTGGLYQNGTVSLNGTLAASGTYKVLTKQTDSTVTQVDVATLLGAGNVSSGTYAATLTNGTNVASSAFQQAFYQRIGSIVTVTMFITIDPTSTGVTDLEISLPIASNLAAGSDLLGHGNCTSIPAQTVTLAAQTTNDRATLSFIATDINSQAFYFSFTYQIL